jgi:L,D-transpeptidase catalytic domain
MQEVFTFPRKARGLAGVALAAACWLVVPTASGTKASSPAADGDGIASVFGAVATKLAAAGLASEPQAELASGRRPARPRRIAVVRRSVALREKPGGAATVSVGSTTEFGSRRVLAVAADRGDWLGVVTTGRPNNRLAWVRSENAGIELRRTRWSLHADLSDRTLELRRDGRRVHRMTVAIGRPGSETPTGRFAVTDKLSGSSYGPYYGCCILALSGNQPNTPPGWTGGNRLAIHGTDAPSTIGTGTSAGCLRASDTALRPLMVKVPLGTTLFVRR